VRRETTASAHARLGRSAALAPLCLSGGGAGRFSDFLQPVFDSVRHFRPVAGDNVQVRSAFELEIVGSGRRIGVLLVLRLRQ
jgi:hypothetical protein